MGGYAKPDMKTESDTMKPLFDAILRHVPPPVGDPNKPLQLQVTTLDYSDFLGRIAPERPTARWGWSVAVSGDG